MSRIHALVDIYPPPPTLSCVLCAHATFRPNFSSLFPTNKVGENKAGLFRDLWSYCTLEICNNAVLLTHSFLETGQLAAMRISITLILF